VERIKTKLHADSVSLRRNKTEMCHMGSTYKSLSVRPTREKMEEGKKHSLSLSLSLSFAVGSISLMSAPTVRPSLFLTAIPVEASVILQ
jgi:hypothetical protein